MSDRPRRIGEVLPIVLADLQAVVGISLRGNPGEAAVGCVTSTGSAFARRVGHMTNHRAAWLGVELAVDWMRGRPGRILHCYTNASIAKDEPYKGGSFYESRDYDVRTRVDAKLGASTVEFVHKRDEPRIEVAQAVARALLVADFPVWVPAAEETERARQRAIARDAEAKIESPVESLIFKAIRVRFPKPTTFFPEPGDRPWHAVPAFEGELGTLIPQLKVGPYRADFGVVNAMVQLLVEIDGYEFHDKTRDQLEHDRQRDRYLMRAGWRTIRFTGREVNRNPQACADEVVATLESIE